MATWKSPSISSSRGTRTWDRRLSKDTRLVIWRKFVVKLTWLRSSTTWVCSQWVDCNLTAMCKDKRKTVRFARNRDPVKRMSFCSKIHKTFSKTGQPNTRMAVKYECVYGSDCGSGRMQCWSYSFPSKKTLMNPACVHVECLCWCWFQ